MQRKEKILLVYDDINNDCVCELSKAMCNIVKFNAVLMLLYLLIVINWLM